MRVMQAVAGAAHGGAETFFVSLVLALHRAGLEQLAVIRRNALRSERLRAGGVEPVELRFGGPLDLATPRALKRLARGFRPDVVVTWMSRASRLFPKGDDVRIARLGGYYDLKYYKGVDHLVGITPEIVDYVVREGWPRECAHYVPNFVELGATAPVARADHATPERVPLVLGLGRLHVNKAFDVLLRAVAGVAEIYLWLGGEGPERARLEALAKELRIGDRVRFLGWRTDLAALYAAADICVFPSRYEPFGIITLEAWAAGVPLIAASAAGPAGVVRPGEDALLVPIDDADALAAALCDLVRDGDLRRRLAAAGHKRWQDDFTEAAAVRNWSALFHQVAS